MRKQITTKEFRAKIAKLAEQNPAHVYRLLSGRLLGAVPFHEFPWLAKELAHWVTQPVSYRLGFLSTFTLEPIRDVLSATALAQGFIVKQYFGGFQQLEQEIMATESGLARFEPQGIVFAWSLQDMSATLWQCPLELTESEIHAEIKNVNNRVTALVEACKLNFPKSQLLMHTFVPPMYPALGIIDFKHSRGHHRIVDDLNAGLLKLAEETQGVHLVDCEGVARRVGLEWFDNRYWYTAHAQLGPKGLMVLGREYVKYVRALVGKTKKALVIDLDNTLWGGVLGEDGINGIALGPNYPGNAFMAFQHEIKQLSRRGVVLAINSKNNKKDVCEAFNEHNHMILKWDDFAATRVNWEDKVTNIRELANELSLGLDSFVFIDDNPYEVEMVQQALPEVTVVQVPREPSELPGLLSKLGFFDSVIYSEEDRKRSEFYRSQAQRTQLKHSNLNLEDFYRSLSMRLTVYDVEQAEIARVAQLTQRTNQFNMTTRRYTEHDIKQFCEDKGHLVRAYRLEDRFGDNGIISVVIIKKQEDSWHLDTFLMSCRVIGRTVESAILSLIAQEARRAGAKSLVGDFLPTRKNAPAKDVYLKHGFEKIDEGSDHIRYELKLANANLPLSDWFEVADIVNET